MLVVPDVRQKHSYDCGAACAAAVARFHGCRMSLADAASQLITSPQSGTDPRGMESWLRRLGLKVLAGEMDLDDLQTQTKRRRPVVLVLSGHYSVGLGVQRGRVWLHDPAEGVVSEPADDFLARWCDHDRLGASYDQFGLVVWR